MKLGKEMINYIIFGVLTTIINLVTYAVFTKVLNVDYTLSITFAWFISIIFAFVTNKLYVFKGKSRRSLLKEFVLFFIIRVASLVLDIVLMVGLVELIGVNDLYAKIVVNIVVIAVNYVASKYIVFVKKRSAGLDK
ncbi:GtrA family protein [Paenibacillus medicaginis]|uniref:GtrA family protein n=1 Tax=Paenibacillus medicaginis TaxID=1470560 RepID=A0ABV5C9B4_9BACL